MEIVSALIIQLFSYGILSWLLFVAFVFVTARVKSVALHPHCSHGGDHHRERVGSNMDRIRDV